MAILAREVAHCGTFYSIPWGTATTGLDATHLPAISQNPGGGWGGYWWEGLEGGGGIGGTGWGGGGLWGSSGGGVIGGWLRATHYYHMHDIEHRAAYPLGRAECHVHPAEPGPLHEGMGLRGGGGGHWVELRDGCRDVKGAVA